MLLLGTGQKTGALPALRLFTGSGNLGFPAHRGLPPKYSHAWQTPWSVFQDGSDQSGSKARSWTNAASGDAGRVVIRSSTSAQPGTRRVRRQWRAAWLGTRRSCPRAAGRARRREGRLIRLLPTISRTISLSFQSSFHLSLTVLVRYRSPANI